MEKKKERKKKKKKLPPPPLYLITSVIHSSSFASALLQGRTGESHFRPVTRRSETACTGTTPSWSPAISSVYNERRQISTSIYLYFIMRLYVGQSVLSMMSCSSNHHWYFYACQMMLYAWNTSDTAFAYATNVESNNNKS